MLAPKNSKVIDTNICTFADEPPGKTDIQVTILLRLSQSLLNYSFVL